MIGTIDLGSLWIPPPRQGIIAGRAYDWTGSAWTGGSDMRRNRVSHCHGRFGNGQEYRLNAIPAADLRVGDLIDCYWFAGSTDEYNYDTYHSLTGLSWTQSGSLATLITTAKTLPEKPGAPTSLPSGGTTVILLVNCLIDDVYIETDVPYNVRLPVVVAPAPGGYQYTALTGIHTSDFWAWCDDTYWVWLHEQSTGSSG